MQLGCLCLGYLWISTWLRVYPLQIDLTEEKRHTLSQATKEQLSVLEGPLDITLYLGGELPAGFKRLREGVEDYVARLQALSAVPIQLHDINPMEGRSAQSRRAYLKSLAQQGIRPLRLNYRVEDKAVERFVFPYVMLNYQGREESIYLLKGNQQAGPEALFNASIESLEYEFLMAIKQLWRGAPYRLGLLSGYDDIDSKRRQHLKLSLASEGYEVIDINLREEESPLEHLTCLVVVSPVHVFSPADLYRLDQYVMRGGKALFFLDGLQVAEDSVGEEGTLAQHRPTGLEDLFFHYGLTLPPQLVADKQAAGYPVLSTFQKNTKQEEAIQLFDWPYFPIITTKSKHPIVAHTPAFLLRYASWLDTTHVEGVSKYPLFYSSKRTRLQATPTVVALNELKLPNPNFPHTSRALSYLLEGHFPSAFSYRPIPKDVSASIPTHLSKSLPTALVVVADGSFPLGNPHPRTGEILDIGLYLPQNRQFGNPDFLFQALAYLYDSQKTILSRNRYVRLRPLDKEKILQNESLYQWSVLLLPLLIIYLLGLIKYLYRKRMHNA